jgi:hypothetical protein
MCVGQHYTQANTYNVNKTWTLLQTRLFSLRSDICDYKAEMKGFLWWENVLFFEQYTLK